jgi:hypothetical protein
MEPEPFSQTEPRSTLVERDEVAGIPLDYLALTLHL